MSQFYLKTREQEKSSRVIYILKIIQFPDKKVTGREAIWVMVLFDNLSNNFSSTGRVSFVGILYFSINVESKSSAWIWSL